MSSPGGKDNRGNDEDSSRDRKMKQPVFIGEASSSRPNPNTGPIGVPHTTLFTTLPGPTQPQLFAHRPFPFDLNYPPIEQLQNSPHKSYVQHVLNSAAPVRTSRPHSFMSLLNSVEEPHYPPLPPPHSELDLIILSHGEKLREWLVKKQQSAEETASIQIREKEHELQRKAAQYSDLSTLTEHYKKQSEKHERRLRYLEQLCDQMRGNLQAVQAMQRRAMVAEDAQSSCDAQLVEGLECKICERQLSVVMMLPCRHVSACKDCSEAAEKCPICDAVKAHSVHVFMIN